MADITHIELYGERHAVVVPQDYAVVEEIIVAYTGATQRGGVAAQRVYAAIVGLCTRVGRSAGADYAAHRFDVLAYGGAVYGWLRREKKCDIPSIGRAAATVYPLLLAAAFPREEEVAAELGKSGGSADA